MDKISGVYQIINVLTGDKYIGSSVDINRRKRYHRSALRNGDHSNIHLQRAYNKYGKKSFRYKVLLYCDPDNTLVYEQILLDAGYGDYNIATDASAPTRGMYGELNPFYGRKHTTETRELISKNHADFSGENHPMYGVRGKDSPAWGRKHSEETKKKLSEIKKEYWRKRRESQGL